MKEIWKDIEGYEGLHQISNMGRVKYLPKSWVSGNGTIKSHPTIITKGSITHCGYLRVHLSNETIKKKQFLVHRLVGKYFIPNPENKRCINHKKGNKLDNRAKMLEWATHSENTTHAFKTGLKNSLSVSGENNHFSKISNKDTENIRKLKHKYKGKDLAKMYNITPAAISLIVNNKTYKN